MIRKTVNAKSKYLSKTNNGDGELKLFLKVLECFRLQVCSFYNECFMGITCVVNR